jgi:hypothetical protein
MLSRFGPLEIWCDAPPYAVVLACKRCGFRSPLDVRWSRTNRFLNAEGQRRGIFVLRLWHWLFGRGRSREHTCTCGHPLPDLKPYAFTFLSKKMGDYFLGQCHRCRTIFWDAALLPWVKDGAVGLTDSLEM